MNRNTLLWGLLTILFAAIIVYSFSGGEPRAEYIERIAEQRAAKDNYFEKNDQSPFVSNNIPFQGLNYYAPDPDYRVTAQISKVNNNTAVELITNDNVQKEYIPYGYAEFKLKGKNHKLLLFEMGDEYKDKLFLPFADETSARETYGAGRYLDIDKPTGNTVIIDFNQAYNPYCAYVDNYSCPFPPKENILDIEIKAGEKTYQ